MLCCVWLWIGIQYSAPAIQMIYLSISFKVASVVLGQWHASHHWLDTNDKNTNKIDKSDEFVNVSQRLNATGSLFCLHCQRNKHQTVSIPRLTQIWPLFRMKPIYTPHVPWQSFEGHQQICSRLMFCMMTSSYGNGSRVAGPLWGNPPVTSGFPSQRISNADFNIFFDVSISKRLNKQSSRRWFETPRCSTWRNCNWRFHCLWWEICVISVRYFAVMKNAILAEIHILVRPPAWFVCNCTVGYSNLRRTSVLTIYTQWRWHIPLASYH